VEETLAVTESNTGMRLTFALSYGSRQEITQAVRAICEDVRTGKIAPEDVNESLISNHLQTQAQGMADPDLILRTSGEFRLSNFLLWQAAYSELFVTQTLWPDFTMQELASVLKQFGTRERRFGRTTAQLRKPTPIDISEIVALTSPARQATVQ
jgi:undecaprenyl diphosphate synthase